MRDEISSIRERFEREHGFAARRSDLNREQKELDETGRRLNEQRSRLDEAKRRIERAEKGQRVDFEELLDEPRR